VARGAFRWAELSNGYLIVWWKHSAWRGRGSAGEWLSVESRLSATTWAALLPPSLTSRCAVPDPGQALDRPGQSRPANPARRIATDSLWHKDHGEPTRTLRAMTAAASRHIVSSVNWTLKAPPSVQRRTSTELGDDAFDWPAAFVAVTVT
jgi:hypothetical protein